ncbi:MAG: hypothetical protein R2824_18430 [Saprospiraceae bacterium]
MRTSPNGFKGDIADYVWRINEHQIRENSNRVIATIAQNWEIVKGLNMRGRLSGLYFRKYRKLELRVIPAPCTIIQPRILFAE